MTEHIDTTLFNPTDIPSDIYVSTICCTCKFREINIDITNIYEHLELLDEDIITIKHRLAHRTINPNYRYKETKKIFQNQLTMEVRPYPERRINVKLFTNGSIQMSGCKSLDNINIVLNKLIKRLQEEKVIEESEVSKKRIIKYIDKSQIVVTDFKINMINCNFEIPYKICTKKLHRLLVIILMMLKERTNGNVEVKPSKYSKTRKKLTKKTIENENKLRETWNTIDFDERSRLTNDIYLEKIDESLLECRFDPGRHAGVNIKIRNNENVGKAVSIFVFQSGKIIITGAKNHEDINIAYRYITYFLRRFSKKVRDISPQLDDSDVDSDDE